MSLSADDQCVPSIHQYFVHGMWELVCVLPVCRKHPLDLLSNLKLTLFPGSEFSNMLFCDVVQTQKQHGSVCIK